MAILDEVIRNAMRVRIIEKDIATDKDFQFENKNFDPNGKKLWIRETWLGGEEQLLTNRRVWIPTSPLIQYDIFVPLHTGTMTVGEIANAIEEEFDIAGEKSRVEISGMPQLKVEVKRIRLSTATEEEWYSQKLLFYLQIFSN